MNGWVHGSYNFQSKFTSQKIELISKWLVKANDYSPSEFTRQSRSLNDLGHWKAIEYRNFLLYFGPVVLKNVLQEDMYEHFLHLSSAIRIFSCDVHTKNPKMRNIAHNFLMDYVEKFIDLYGIDSISHNVHNLCHLADDVEQYGSLSNISAYPFESTLYRIKRCLKTGKSTLAQVAKRIIESYNLNENSITPVIEYPILEAPLKGKSTNNEIVYSKIRFKTFMLAGNLKNQWFLTKNGDLVAMEYVYQVGNVINIMGRKIKKLYDFFKRPFSSHFLNIYEAELNFNDAKPYHIEEIKCKMVGLKGHNSSFIFFPLLHTL